MKRALLLLLLLILVGAAINLVIAVQCIRGSGSARSATLINEFGAAAAARGWPVTTPHATPWPGPSHWQMDGGPGYRYLSVRGVNPDAPTQTLVAMEVERMGWPLPALQRVQMWWPWDDPAWQTAADHTPGLALHWPGVIGNPLIFGGALWTVFVLPFVLFGAFRRRLRSAHNCCLECGHPRGPNARCTECGHEAAAA